MTVILEADVLTKRFGGLVAVDKVSFAAEAGRILAIIGPNGAGKSTLFKLVSGFETPTSGSVRIAGRDVTGLPPNLIARAGLVRTFQENTVFAEMSPREAVMMAQHHTARASMLDFVLGLPAGRRERRRFSERASELLDFVGIAHVADQPCASLPHGHLRLLGIAVAIAARPRILLLDEPFAGLNETETRNGAELVRRLAGDGMTVVLVEHDMRAVMAISDRVLVLNFGTVIAEGSPAEIQRDEAVIEAYLGVAP